MHGGALPNSVLTSSHSWLLAADALQGGRSGRKVGLGWTKVEERWGLKGPAKQGTKRAGSRGRKKEKDNRQDASPFGVQEETCKGNTKRKK